jgi:hypothetical protein
MYINEKTPQYPEESPEAIPVGHKASLRFIITCCISISQVQGLINNIFYGILKKSIFITKGSRRNLPDYGLLKFP